MSLEAQIAIGVGVLLVVAAAAAFGPRLRIPAPLLLVVVGIAVSVLPFVGDFAIQPELVLTVVLPPLLYASSVSVPSMELRREFGTISALSVLLVVVSALALGWVFTLLIPGLPYALGVALGAVVSPTDAVATSIVKRTPVSRRVVAILEGESLLNDASALVLLRTAIAAAGAAVSLPGVVGEFAYSLVVAILIGVVIGRVTLWVRSKVTDPTVNTVISFTVPFLVSLPAELLHASGLVAAVAAGLVVGRRAPRMLSPEHRRSDQENWSTVSLVLEGAVFLGMGLEISKIVSDAGGASTGWRALGIALVALAGVLVVRSLFVVPLLLVLRANSRRGPESRQRLEQMQARVEAGTTIRTPLGERAIRASELDRFGKRLRQALADIDYLAASPLGPKEGAVVVWAGMRGAITVAAAQTIETGTEFRPLLVLVAFGVAAVSLLLQGGTLSLLIRVLKPAADDPAALEQERQEVQQLIRSSFVAPSADGARPGIDDRLAQLHASREALLDARDDGVFSSEVLAAALASIDAGEITMRLMGEASGTSSEPPGASPESSDATS